MRRHHMSLFSTEWGLNVPWSGAQGHAPPLPCDPAAAAAGSAVDLWAAHGNSGCIDPEHVRPRASQPRCHRHF